MMQCQAEGRDHSVMLIGETVVMVMVKMMQWHRGDAVELEMVMIGIVMRVMGTALTLVVLASMVGVEL